MQLTETLLKQVLFLNRKKFKPSQIAVVTGLTPYKISKLLKAKYVNRKEKRSNKIFDWNDFKDGI